MQACKLADYEMRSDYENAKHVLIWLILNEWQIVFLSLISLYCLLYTSDAADE